MLYYELYHTYHVLPIIESRLIMSEVQVDEDHDPKIIYINFVLKPLAVGSIIAYCSRFRVSRCYENVC
jgi:hypothetical protein